MNLSGSSDKGRPNFPHVVPSRVRRMIAFVLLAGLGIGLTVALGQTDEETGKKSVLDLSAYTLTFNEEFDRLDVSAWGPGTRWIAHTPCRLLIKVPVSAAVIRSLSKQWHATQQSLKLKDYLLKHILIQKMH